MTVSELTLAIKDDLENQFSSVWVTGEVSGVKKYGAGHIYFTLKDAACSFLRCSGASAVPQLKFELRDGMKVFAARQLGRLSAAWQVSARSGSA